MKKGKGASSLVVWVFAVVFLLAAGSLGFWAGKSQLSFSRIVKTSLQENGLEQVASYDRNREIFQHAFKKRMLEYQLYPPVASLEEVSEHLNSMYLPVESFYGAYEALQLIGDNRTGKTFRVDYKLADRNYSAYSYRRDAATGSAERSCAALIIPGSGKNQSTAIFNKDTANYHGDILNVVEPKCDSYVLVKPNEDFLAIHDGKRKLSYDFILRYLLNKGGSYSAHYLAGSLAITKYLKKTYDQVYVVGLSQGGEASLFNALQSRPTAAVVASGFSLFTEEVDWAGFKQLIIHGLRRKYDNERIYQEIERSPTRYLFTYGRRETGTYRIEAEEKLVCNQFGSLVNVECFVHDGGHSFANEKVRRFIEP